jgi:hypothetical protein
VQDSGQDRYVQARDRALERLAGDLEPDRLRRLGARVDEETGMTEVPVLCWRVQVGLHPYSMTLVPDGGEPDVTWQILILNYLASPNPVAPAGFVSFADFPDGRSYQSVYEARVDGRLGRTVGRDYEGFVQAVARLGGAVVEGDPTRCMLRFFPLLDFEVVRTEADADFAASCSVLVPDNALEMLSVEDLVVAAEKLVGALAGQGLVPEAPRP